MKTAIHTDCRFNLIFIQTELFISVNIHKANELYNLFISQWKVTSESGMNLDTIWSNCNCN